MDDYIILNYLTHLNSINSSYILNRLTNKIKICTLDWNPEYIHLLLQSSTYIIYINICVITWCEIWRKHLCHLRSFESFEGVHGSTPVQTMHSKTVVAGDANNDVN